MGGVTLVHLKVAAIFCCWVGVFFLVCATLLYFGCANGVLKAGGTVPWHLALTVHRISSPGLKQYTSEICLILAEFYTLYSNDLAAEFAQWW